MISNGGGNTPRWRGDSKELYYGAGGRLFAVDIATKGIALVAGGVPKALFDYRGIANNSHPSHFTSYDVASDGQKFLLTRRETDNEGQAPIVVVLNWRSGIR